MQKVQLFCLPYAGGNANVFNEMEKYIDPRIQVVKIEYPGRGIRREEPFHDTIDQLIEDVASNIRKNRSQELPFAILGYSFGSALTYELINRSMLIELPFHLFISARESLDEQIDSKDYSDLSPDEFMVKIKELGGMDERILHNRRFLSIYMKPILQDYKLWKQYTYKQCREKTTVDITVFYSEQDTPYGKVEGWKHLTNGNVEFHEFGSNHFFLREHAKDMAAVINKVLIQH